ncbi:hypothetical protein KOI35_12995 [Actinoplanes bogorensis]|uniref:Uncharacterized protein n=1 Tax=Paractinoplanes bogorensis TaxID=1610840 RepID=A0ABS5YNW8_9ACTN|nr:hypothetical protein [Actinoplanes bogorensis]MBU2664413.1 hypothetical protein [Actinoplanes bogorensis]
MSLIQDLGAQLRAISDELPTGQVTVALEKLRSATELLTWVRETSQNPLGVPQLGNATEHAEQAAAALRLAQDSIERYLASIGLGGGSGPAPVDRDWKAGLERPVSEKTEAQEETTEQLGPWWQKRVTQLTGEPAPDKNETRQTDTAELLRRVASGVRAGDRARLGRELHGVSASTGLGLSAVSSPVLHRLAGDLLGHEPRPEDVPRLRAAAEGRVKSLLPGTSPAVLETLIDRICRVPVSNQGGPQNHPADSAVTASVLTGVLLARLGRDAGSLDPAAPDPVPGSADDSSGGSDG